MTILTLILALSAHAGDPTPMFQTSDRCQACHNGLLTSWGEDVSIGGDWRSSMMANAARDPYWHASVRRETLDHPAASEAIQDKCSTCHMPMDRYEAVHVRGEVGQVFANMPHVDGASPLAVDGASCATCHRISAEGLGEPSTFTGGFHVDASTSAVLGPYEVDAGRTRVMRSSSGGFEPAQAEHVRSAALCASCHTLYTHAIAPDGSDAGILPEQVPYLEWQHSAYRDTQSCQGCHMPLVEEDVAVSSVLPQPREGARRHVFRGGNFFMPRVLSRYRAEVAATASPAELGATAAASASHLQTRTATLAVQGVEEDGVLALEVVVTNLAGHKLPTAYPSRRVWLHVVVRDAAGTALFESGALRPDGSIAGNDNDVDPTRYEPHYDAISAPDQVQIWEPILGDPGGAVTTGLLTASQYLKDNRLLPEGFDKTTAHADVAVYGAARDDADFTAGSDRVAYRVDLAESSGPWEAEVALWYQPIGHRWATNLDGRGTAETDRWSGIYAAMAPASGLVITRAAIQVAAPADTVAR